MAGDEGWHKGRIEVVSKLFSDNELTVAGRKKPKLVEGLHRQRSAVLEAVSPKVEAPTIHMVLCFVDGDFPLFGGEGQVNEVHVVSSNTISRLITNSGTTQLDVEHMAAIINQALPPAQPLTADN